MASSPVKWLYLTAGYVSLADKWEKMKCSLSVSTHRHLWVFNICIKLFVCYQTVCFLSIACYCIYFTTVLLYIHKPIFLICGVLLQRSNDRSWKPVWATLKDQTLYLFKEKSTSVLVAFEIVPIRLTFAMQPSLFNDRVSHRHRDISLGFTAVGGPADCATCQYGWHRLRLHEKEERLPSDDVRWLRIPLPGWRQQDDAWVDQSDPSRLFPRWLCKFLHLLPAFLIICGHLFKSRDLMTKIFGIKQTDNQTYRFTMIMTF